jgi:hypothetical protein
MIGAALPLPGWGRAQPVVRFGAPGRIRTCGLGIRSPLLYPLSYERLRWRRRTGYRYSRPIRLWGARFRGTCGYGVRRTQYTTNQSLSHVCSWPYLARVQVTSGIPLPVLAAARDLPPDEDPHGPVLDDFLGDLRVGYSFGPPYGQRLVSWYDLDKAGLSRRALRREAARHLDDRLPYARVHGQPPALMLDFDGLASTLVLADPLWADLAAAVPGELVVGVPARDVVIVTGSASRPGLEKARRAVDRVFFAGDRHLLTRQLLVRRRGVWEPFDGPGAQRAHAVTVRRPHLHR